MRIAIFNSYRNIIGGVETYLRQLLPALIARGHRLAFGHEEAAIAERELIPLPEDIALWTTGINSSLDELRQWRPDVIYLHGLRSPELEAEIQKIAPTVFFAHDYYGSCISGSKTFSFPVAQPCARQFNWQCLMHYYPHRCGGLNPLTMMRQYRLQKNRLSLLSTYTAIVVASSHMADEYRKYGLSDNLSVAPYPITPAAPEGDFRTRQQSKDEWRLLFLGRMESLKGGMVMLEALPAVASAIERPLHVTFAGEGRARSLWEQRAFELAAVNPFLKFNFTGWLDEYQRSDIIRSCDLLVVPSVWPEPFGLVGLEAGLYGLPAIAFAHGGIPDWLIDGVNGVLASGNPPRAAGLSAAIIRCLSDKSFYDNLRCGAIKQAHSFSMENHLAHLLPVLERAADTNHVVRKKL